MILEWKISKQSFASFNHLASFELKQSKNKAWTMLTLSIDNPKNQIAYCFSRQYNSFWRKRSLRTYAAWSRADCECTLYDYAPC